MKTMKKDKALAWFNKHVPHSLQVNIICVVLGCCCSLVFIRGCCKSQVIIQEVPVEVEKIIYREPEKEQHTSDAVQIARVLYGLREYNLSKRAKIAVVEVILNRVNDNAREFRNFSTVQEICNQPSQWEGYSADSEYLTEDYEIALNRLADDSGARVIPEGCYFLSVKYGSVTVRTAWTGGNEWKVD